MRPYTLLSCAISIDGYLDDASERRLLLSNDADFDEIDQVRAGCDAIMVGAGTIRSDDPRLLVRSSARRAARVGRGLPPSPVRVTVTRSGDLPSSSQFFSTAGAESLVYSDSAVVSALTARLAPATVVDVGSPVVLASVLEDLATRGVRRLLVEGGSALLGAFVRAELADELRLAVAPVLVGDPTAPRFLPPGPYPSARVRLESCVNLGDVAVLTYALSDRFVS